MENVIYEFKKGVGNIVCNYRLLFLWVFLVNEYKIVFLYIDIILFLLMIFLYCFNLGEGLKIIWFINYYY